MTTFAPRVDGLDGDGDGDAPGDHRRSARLRQVPSEPQPVWLDPLSAPLSEVEAAAAADVQRRSMSALRHITVDSAAADLADQASRRNGHASGFERNGHANGYERNGHANGYERNGHANGYERNGYDQRAPDATPFPGPQPAGPPADPFDAVAFGQSAPTTHVGRHGSALGPALGDGLGGRVDPVFGGRPDARLTPEADAGPIVGSRYADALPVESFGRDDATPLFMQTWSSGAAVSRPVRPLEQLPSASVLPPRPISPPDHLAAPDHLVAPDYLTAPDHLATPDQRPARGRQRRPAQEQGGFPAMAVAQTAAPHDADARLQPDARHRATTTASSVNGRVRQIAVGLVGVGFFVAAMLWAAAGGVENLAAPSRAVISLSGLAGLLGTDLLLVQVVLGARVPVLERAFGRSQLNRWYSVAGATSFTLIVLHIGLVISGTALVERFNVFEAAWRLVSTTSGAPLAVLGLVFLVLAALSVRRDVKRHDTIRLLHVYCYAGLVLALPHQLLAGTSLTASPLAAAYWWFSIVAVTATLVMFRFGLPLFRSLRFQMVVADVVPESDGATSIYLRGRQLRDLGARAGEFFHWRFLDGAKWHQSVSHPLSAMPARDQLRITVASVKGDRLATLTPGTWVLFEGPYGAMTADIRTRPRLAFFACGFGVAQARTLLEELEYARDEAMLVYRIPPDEAALFRDELEDLSQRRGADVVYLDGPPPEDRESWLPAAAANQIGDVDAIGHLVPDVTARDVFVMGPEAWTATMVDALTAAGVPRDQLHVETLSW